MQWHFLQKGMQKWNKVQVLPTVVPPKFALKNHIKWARQIDNAIILHSCKIRVWSSNTNLCKEKQKRDDRVNSCGCNCSCLNPQLFTCWFLFSFCFCLHKVLFNIRFCMNVILACSPYLYFDPKVWEHTNLSLEDEGNGTQPPHCYRRRSLRAQLLSSELADWTHTGGDCIAGLQFQSSVCRSCLHI